MIFNKEGATTIITQEKTTIVEFVKGVEDRYDTLKNDNIIINLFSLDHISVDDINEFLRISNQHKTSKHSFVIVTNKITYDDVPGDITIVPTLQEAYDLVEMEEIERDLGF
ncbi:ribonuclease Z [Aquimarina sp. AD10]|uniref:Ribonuclease Z n=1 Tax=Aquimarina aggregata TaxID=1642818 RepID=A0A163CAJ0_9FLAO|nr:MULTISPECIES: ribonuclease Z [Aquimarina]AXT59793.1 ribonuclease Z [Aquimarina sp. AD10]KZS42221.1 ribonuclease Z [Aquimarina aggregata]RKM97663.1 ribonuclease Z [Aquimarina sp. AD10]